MQFDAFWYASNSQNSSLLAIGKHTIIAYSLIYFSPILNILLSYPSQHTPDNLDQCSAD